MSRQAFSAPLGESGSRGGRWVRVPFDAREVFGEARPPVRGTVNGTPIRGRLAVYGGETVLGLRREIRDAAGGIEVGDLVEVVLERDDEPREIDLPAELDAVLSGDAEVAPRSTRSPSPTAASTPSGWARRSAPRPAPAAPSARSRCCATGSATPDAQRAARHFTVPDLHVWIVRPLARSAVRALSENVPRAPREPSSAVKRSLTWISGLALRDRVLLVIGHTPARVDGDVGLRSLDADRQLAVVALHGLAEQRAAEDAARGRHAQHDRAARAGALLRCRAVVARRLRRARIAEAAGGAPRRRTSRCRCDSSSCGPRASARSSR